MAVAEAYPDLKANQNMMMLQEELTSTENKVAFARQAFNDSVMVYNTERETFPNNIVAGIGGFTAGAALRDRVAQGARGAAGVVLMDFFQHQETARRKTGLLVFYFAAAVVLIVLLDVRRRRRDPRRLGLRGPRRPRATSSGTRPCSAS